MNCRGLHCPGCHRSGPGAPIIALLGLLAISAAARAVVLVLPILLHVLIVTAITAASAAAVITAAVLAIRRTARSDRPALQPQRRVQAQAIRAAVGHRSGLPAPPGSRALPAPAAVPDTAPPPAPHQASRRTPPR